MTMNQVIVCFQVLVCFTVSFTTYTLIILKKDLTKTRGLFSKMHGRLFYREF